jgi:L-fuconolactonase
MDGLINARNKKNKTLRIDAHQHFWNYNPVRYAWINEEMKAIQRDFLPEELESTLKENKIDGTVAVQADQTEEETIFLLKLADKYEFIKGVVGWVDLRSSQLDERLAFFSKHKKLKGLRHIVQAEPLGFLRHPDFIKGVARLRDRNLTYDILIYPSQLDDALYFVNQLPDQKFVIDHLAKPNIRRKEFATWSQGMKALAKFPNVYCKLSGMVTEAHWSHWHAEDFIPYLEFVLQHFGTKRIMYGSDWPVCLVAATYEQQLNLIETFIRSLSASEKQQIMGENAIQFYNL